MKKLYIFKIGTNVRKSSEQDELRKEVVRLLKVANVEFMLGGTKSEGIREIYPAEFTFETMKEAVQMAINVLETNTVFFCSLTAKVVK